MDAETIKSLVSILIWGGLFVVMMRFGCGAHIMGGHGHHGGPGRNEGPGAAGPVKDPVCGMSIEPGKAAAASVYRGQTHYFCSTSCRDKFEKAPEKYAAASAGEAMPGGHRHG